MAEKKVATTSGFTKEEELLLQDFSRNVGNQFNLNTDCSVGSNVFKLRIIFHRFPARATFCSMDQRSSCLPYQFVGFSLFQSASTKYLFSSIRVILEDPSNGALTVTCVFRCFYCSQHLPDGYGLPKHKIHLEAQSCQQARRCCVP